MSLRTTPRINFLKPALLAFSVSAAATFGASALHAADAPVAVAPVPIAQDGRFFPGGLGNEGFIITRFTVTADGTTDDIEIVGGFTNPFVERQIEDTVAKWTYTPGTVNGTPAAFYNQEFIFRPKISETLASSPDFQEEYTKLNEQVTAGELDAAVRRIEGSFRQHVHTVLDYAVTNYALSRIYLQQGDPFKALDAVQKTTLTSITPTGEVEYMLTPDLLEGALRQQLVLSSGVHQEGEVLRTWEVLDALYDIPAEDKLHELVAAARMKVESPDPLPALAKIIDNKVTYRPVHRIFTVTDVMGELETITARCDHRNLELEYQPEVDWTLPPSLGNCVLDFAGDDDTTFTIYEFKE
jgi:TonB family protein